MLMKSPDIISIFAIATSQRPRLMLNMKEVNTQTLGGTNYEGGLGG